MTDQSQHQGATVDELLGKARSNIERVTPAQLAELMNNTDDDDSLLVIDVRERPDRERTGIIPGSVNIPLIVLEWRCDPTSPHAHPAVRSHQQQLVMVCNQGYSSSLAAASVKRLGFDQVADLTDGIAGWAAAGLPLAPPEQLP